MSLGQVIDEIRRLECFNNTVCPSCHTSVRYHALQIYANCPKCNTQIKVRAFGGVGTEIQDVIDAVLEWIGDGENLEAVLKRHKQIREGVSD